MTSSRASAGAALLGPLELVGKLFDAPLDVALEMIRPFVLRDDTQHLPQPLQALAGVTRFAERGLGGPILGREVRGHDGSIIDGRVRAQLPGFKADSALMITERRQALAKIHRLLGSGKGPEEK